MQEKIVDKLSDWFKKFSKYIVRYKNGCFHLTSINNSPETVITSFDKMPFCKHDKAKKKLFADTIFFKAFFYYCNPEEDLWMFVSGLNFKKNVLMKNLFVKDVPADYHFINLHFKNKNIVSKSTINGLILKNSTWSMFKAGQDISEYHIKNSKERNITIYFTSKWLEKQKATNPIFRKSKLADFFDSKNSYLFLEEDNSKYENVYENLLSLAKKESGEKWLKGSKKYIDEILIGFINKLNSEVIEESHFHLSDKDRKNVQQIEKFLSDNLFGNFPGIEKIAAKAGISPTKAKSDFKSIHNKTLLQYFSSLQMQIANQLLEENKHTVKEVANLLGYENASKFSAVFKKHFSYNPSSILLDENQKTKNP